MSYIYEYYLKYIVEAQAHENHNQAHSKLWYDQIHGSSRLESSRDVLELQILPLISWVSSRLSPI